MERFVISNRIGGVVLGVFAGKTDLDAYKAMLRWAGDDEAAPAIPDDIRVQPVEDVVKKFARRSAQMDFRICSAHEDLEMTGDWAGEHTDALADLLKMDVEDLGDLIDIAEREYRREARRLMKADA